MKWVDLARPVPRRTPSATMVFVLRVEERANLIAKIVDSWRKKNVYVSAKEATLAVIVQVRKRDEAKMIRILEILNLLSY